MDRLWDNFNTETEARPSHKELINELRKGVNLEPIKEPSQRDILTQAIYEEVTTVYETLRGVLSLVEALAEVNDNNEEESE